MGNDGTPPVLLRTGTRHDTTQKRRDATHIAPSQTGWTTSGGSWNATNGYLTKTAAGAATACHSQTSDDLEYRISYYADDTTSDELLAKISPRYEADEDKVSVVILEDRMYLEGGQRSKGDSNRF